MPAVFVTVRGRVQGVGFRWFARRHAVALRLAGYARNHPDGTVEVYAEGPRPALEQLVHALREGPPAARVSGVDPVYTDDVRGLARFETD